jgi:hypothetical protein
MATKCRKIKKISKDKIVDIYTYGILSGLVMTGVAVGFVIGTVTTPVVTKTVTETITVEVPTLNADKLPEVTQEFFYDIPLSENLQRYIFEICKGEDVPVSLVLAMIEHESAFNPDAVSSTEDYGLMQINKVNHAQLEQDYRSADMLNPYQNVFCGIKIIGSYLKKYDGDLHKALMSYNMGEYGARKAWEEGVHSTEYSTRILELMEQY